MDPLSAILSSKARAAFCRLLFGITPKELHLRDIARLSGLVIGTIQQEASKLLKLDLINLRRDGNRCYYKANTAHPLYAPIHDIVLKTSGLADVLKPAFAHSGIKTAFVFGSVANGTASASSDIDLFIIGEIGLRTLSKRLKKPAESLGREINPHVFTIKEFLARKKRQEHFVKSVLAAPRIFIIGNDDEFERLA